MVNNRPEEVQASDEDDLRELLCGIPLSISVDELECVAAAWIDRVPHVSQYNED
jgi:hypothetical protein